MPIRCFRIDHAKHINTPRRKRPRVGYSIKEQGVSWLCKYKFGSNGTFRHAWRNLYSQPIISLSQDLLAIRPCGIHISLYGSHSLFCLPLENIHTLATRLLIFYTFHYLRRNDKPVFSMFFCLSNWLSQGNCRLLGTSWCRDHQLLPGSSSPLWQYVWLSLVSTLVGRY